jgi:hypothetical protein
VSPIQEPDSPDTRHRLRGGLLPCNRCRLPASPGLSFDNTRKCRQSRNRTHQILGTAYAVASYLVTAADPLLDLASVSTTPESVANSGTGLARYSAPPTRWPFTLHSELPECGPIASILANPRACKAETLFTRNRKHRLLGGIFPCFGADRLLRLQRRLNTLESTLIPCANRAYNRHPLQGGYRVERSRNRACGTVTGSLRRAIR